MEDIATLASLIEAIAVEKRDTLFDDPDTRWKLEEVVDRIKAREPFLADTFSRRAVNQRLQQGEHHVLMHQQL